MSNEYKEWKRDAAQDYLLENELLNKINHVSPQVNGFFIHGESNYGEYRTYFVWLDEVEGWSYRTVK